MEYLIEFKYEGMSLWVSMETCSDVNSEWFRDCVAAAISFKVHCLSKEPVKNPNGTVRVSGVNVRSINGEFCSLLDERVLFHLDN